ncbi:methionine ABC transporter permease [Calorimonas adulescens]|jgi:Binding-protein-dependent transport system inner membrane component.|uniref:ABC transporter permease n=1 Tax=Calorimonas adulescens TaxID=2606906 RepID=A0A5D8QB69_9THEO|nr:ABC transporter permease [Calorimonas adulescens]
MNQEIMRILNLLLPSLWQSIYMVFASTIFSLILGLPLGVLLVITEKGGIMEKPALNNVLGTVINILRSFPFLILMIVILPLSRLVVGTTIGTTATIVPLSIAATPFVARVIESSLKEVDRGVIEASLSMGATPFQIITRVLIPESLPSLILGITLTIINIIGYSAMAGAIGGGGLGDLAIRYGYQRYDTHVLIATVIVLIVIVQVVQIAGSYLAKKVDRR